MTSALCDASVVVKWFVDEPGDDLGPSRAILAAHRSGVVRALILDLTLYEVASALRRRGGEPAEIHAANLFLALALANVVVAMPWLTEAATKLAEARGLSFYDASYLAAGSETNAPVISADRALIKAGALTPQAFCVRLGLA